MHDVGVSAACHQARAQSVLEHVARTPGVLADYDFGLLVKPLAVIPSEKTSDLDSVIECQSLVGFASEAVSTEIFTHRYNLLTVSGLQSLALLDVQEILVCVNCQLAAGFLVARDDSAVVHLQC